MVSPRSHSLSRRVGRRPGDAPRSGAAATSTRQAIAAMRSGSPAMPSMRPSGPMTSAPPSPPRPPRALRPPHRRRTAWLPSRGRECVHPAFHAAPHGAAPTAARIVSDLGRATSARCERREPRAIAFGELTCGVATRVGARARWTHTRGRGGACSQPSRDRAGGPTSSSRRCRRSPGRSGSNMPSRSPG